MKGIITLIAIILSTAIIVCTGPGCANIIPPQGGPRDSIPPRLIKATPPDSSRNFSSNRITFSFDEYVDVQDVRQNLIVSPIQKNDPDVQLKLNTITVKWKDALEPNTTYSLNFGNAIKDFNEGNVLRSFTYMFSTGASIDSLELHGKLILAETGKTDSTLIVMLHTKSDDSAVFKEKPRYITRTDAAGNFVFKHLPPSTFYVYALADPGGSHRYYSGDQLFAFADKPVTIRPRGDTLTLYAYADKPSASSTTRQGSLPGLGRGKLGGNSTDKRLKYQANLIGREQDLLDSLVLTFEAPLKKFDSTKMKLRVDSGYNVVSGYHIHEDSNHRKISISVAWQENTVYHLIMDKDFAEDSTGKKLLKTDTLNYSTKKKSDYGSLILHFRNIDLSKNPLLQITRNEVVFKSFSLTSPDFSQPLFLPGDYELRMLFDTNRNGVWDPGEFFGKHKQPEIVRPIGRRIQVKPGNPNEFEIAL